MKSGRATKKRKISDHLGRGKVKREEKEAKSREKKEKGKTKDKRGKKYRYGGQDNPVVKIYGRFSNLALESFQDKWNNIQYKVFLMGTFLKCLFSVLMFFFLAFLIKHGGF